MAVQQELMQVLDDVLTLQDHGAAMTRSTELLGSLPELDSMSVMAVITALESRFGFTIHPEELDSASFATVGSLSDFVESKLDDEGRDGTMRDFRFSGQP